MIIRVNDYLPSQFLRRTRGTSLAQLTRQDSYVASSGGDGALDTSDFGIDTLHSGGYAYRIGREETSRNKKDTALPRLLRFAGSPANRLPIDHTLAKIGSDIG